MDFFKLAYLIEIAIVINFAYRELKYQQLHTHVREKINTIENKVKAAEVTKDFPPYLILLSLVSCAADEKRKEDKSIGCIWSDNEKLGKFYRNYIRSQLAVKITKWCIGLCVIILILMTLSYACPPSMEIELLATWARAFDLYIFIFIAIALTVACLVPLFLMRKTTECTIYLFGSAEDDTPGQIKLFEMKVDSHLAEEAASMKAEINSKFRNNKDLDRRKSERRQPDQQTQTSDKMGSSPSSTAS